MRLKPRAPQVRVLPPADLYASALSGGAVFVQAGEGTRRPLDVDRWRRLRPGDHEVLSRCSGPTLDVGCGPGRMTHALVAAGVPALGIDVSEEAVRLTRERGAAALCRDVFSRVPAAGRWHHVLLLDGNIGIAGDPAALLRRCRELLAHGGSVLAEVAAPDVATQRLSMRLVAHGKVSQPFVWSIVGADAIGAFAATAGLCVAARWFLAGRWFVALQAASGAAG